MGQQARPGGLAELFETHRDRLHAIAHRMPSSAAEAAEADDAAGTVETGSAFLLDGRKPTYRNFEP